MVGKFCTWIAELPDGIDGVRYISRLPYGPGFGCVLFLRRPWYFMCERGRADPTQEIQKSRLMISGAFLSIDLYVM